MSWEFSRDEVPHFNEQVDGYGRRSTRICVACQGDTDKHDRSTGLCRPCWRIVILGPSMATRTDRGRT